MKRVLSLAGALALAFTFASGSAQAGDLKLNGVMYPEGKKIALPFIRSAIAPKAAVLTGTVKAQGTQTDVEVAWDKMEPAILFSGNITSYSVWAITPDGRPENLGELPVRDKKSGDASYRTGKKNFALLVTAEVLPGSLYPTELVVFTSGRTDETKGAKNSEFFFPLNFPLPALIRPGNPSIAELKYASGGEQIELQQARKAYDMATEIDAASIDPKSMATAKTQLAQAENTAKSVTSEVKSAASALKNKLKMSF